jgi:hypothetical protein
MTELRNAPQKPENLLELIDELLAHPCPANADQFYECIVNFTEWDRAPEGWPSRFMEDSEWNWRRGRPPVEDW